MAMATEQSLEPASYHLEISASDEFLPEGRRPGFWRLLTILAVVGIGLVLLIGATRQPANMEVATRSVIGQGSTVKDRKDFPFIVRVSAKLQCTGSIVDREWILTAAHCVDATKTGQKIVAGTIWKDDDCSHRVFGCSEQIRTVDRVVIHPNEYYDVALLRVSKKFDLEDRVKVVPVKDDADPEKDDTFIIAGWGMTDNGKTEVTPRLQKGKVQVDLVSSSTLASIIVRKKDGYPCLGDSGGPLMKDVGWFSTKLVVIGTLKKASSAKQCKDNPQQASYANARDFYTWMTDTI